MTVAVFTSHIVSIVFNAAVSNRHDRQLNIFFAATVHTMVVLTYTQIYLRNGSGSVVWTTSYGSRFWPARINLWTHSSMSQVFSFAASPHAVEKYGISTILRRVRDVLLMFLFGFLATARPAAAVPPALEPAYTLTALACAMPFLWRILVFLDDAVGLCLRVPDGADASDTNRSLMRALGRLIVASWVLFPLVWCVAALKLITPHQECTLNSALDLVAKGGATLALQHGRLASGLWEERTERATLLQASQAVVQGFKLFTQCIGHDLRTPIQALIFSNLKAKKLVREHMARVAEAEAAAAAASSTSSSAAAAEHPPPPLPSAGRRGSGDSDSGAGAKAAAADGGGSLAAKVSRGEFVMDAPVDALGQAIDRLDEVGACAELLTCIVSNIWDFEKLSAVGSDGSSANAVATEEAGGEICVRETLEQIVAMLQRSPLHKESVVLRAVCDDMIPQTLWGNSTLLVRCLLNLTCNALKFTERGHVTVRTSLLGRAPPSEGEDASTGERIVVRFDIVDTGKGMTGSEMAEARKPYVQGVERGRVSGLGLGLPIVIAAVERAGGTFEMASRVGVGTRCSFELILRHPPTMDFGHSPRAGEVGMRKKRVLVVDDVEMIRSGAAEILASYGHIVSMAEDGIVGLKLLKETVGKLDVALVDIQMPGLCGDELIVLFREWERETRPDKRRLRVYACTGNATSTDADAYMKAGFDGCLSKPVYPHVFKAILSDNRMRVQSALVPGCEHAQYSSGSDPSTPLDTPPSDVPSRAGSSDLEMHTVQVAMAQADRAERYAKSPSPSMASDAGSETYGSRFTRRADVSWQTVQPTPSTADVVIASTAAAVPQRSASIPLQPPLHQPPLQPLHQPPLQPVGGMGSLAEASHENSAYPSPVSHSSSFKRVGGGLDSSSFKRATSSSSSASQHNSASSIHGDAPRTQPRVVETHATWSHLADETERAKAKQLSADLPPTVLDAVAIMRDMGHSEAGAAKMLKTFASYVEGQRTHLCKAVEDNAWAPENGSVDRSGRAVRSLAHSVKGAASMVAARRLTAMSKRVQDACEPLRVSVPPAEAVSEARIAAEVWKEEVATLLRVLNASGELESLVKNAPIWVVAHPSSAAHAHAHAE